MQLESQQIYDYLVDNQNVVFFATCPEKNIQIKLQINWERNCLRLDAPVHDDVQVTTFNKLMVFARTYPPKERYLLSDEFISAVKQHTLSKQITEELFDVKEAVVALLEHDSLINAFPTWLNVYRLKNPDFYMHGKGKIIFFSSNEGSRDNPLHAHTLKGYVLDGQGEIRQIKYESVQAWRYEKFTRKDLHRRAPAELRELLRE